MAKPFFMQNLCNQCGITINWQHVIDLVCYVTGLAVLISVQLVERLGQLVIMFSNAHWCDMIELM